MIIRLEKISHFATRILQVRNMHDAVMGGAISSRLPFHYAIWHMPRKPDLWVIISEANNHTIQPLPSKGVPAQVIATAGHALYT